MLSGLLCLIAEFFFLKQKTVYELRISDWSSDVCSTDLLRAIVDQLGRTRRLTEQLLSLAHASQADPTPRQLLDLNELARSVVLQYLPLSHEKRQDLGWAAACGGDAAAGSPVIPVVGSDVELHEALSNLVHNAIHYAPAGARITVSVARRGERAEVAVSDNGPGLDATARARAFARFDRSEEHTSELQSLMRISDAALGL